MRAGVLLPVIPSRPAGVGRYAHEVLSRLNTLGVSLVPIAQRVETSASWADPDIIRVPGHLPLGRVTGPVRRAVRLAWAASASFAEVLQNERIDVVYGVAQEGPMTSSGPPVCLVVHDLIPLRARTGRRIDALLLRTAFRKMLRRADAIIAVSHATRDDICELLGLDATRITVIPSGVDHERFYPRPAPERQHVMQRHGLSENFILHVGTLDSHKRVDLLVRALGRPPLRGTDVRLVLAGPLSRSRLERLLNIARREDVADRIDAVGYVTSDELPALLSQAQVVCQASHTEGFGLAAVEAMACGAPIIVSSATALAETVGDAGGVVIEPDPAAWADAIGTALGVDNARFRKQSIERATRFDWAVCAVQTFNVLERLSLQQL